MTNQYYNPTIIAVPGTTVRSAQFNDNNDSVSEGFEILPEPADLFVDRQNFAVATQPTANIYEVTVNAVVVTSFLDGAIIRFRAPAANTGPAQLNLNNLGLKQIRTQQGTPLVGNDIPADAVITVIYNLPNDYWQLDTSLTAINEAANNAANSATASANSATDSQNSANASADSATDSANSATAADNSATDAANSATAAADSATDAAASFNSLNSIVALPVINWVQGETATNPAQRYVFEGNFYVAPTASNDNSIALGATPVGDANWQSWAEAIRYFVYEETTTAAKTEFDVGSTIETIADVYVDTNLQNTNAYSFTAGQQIVTFNEAVPTGTYVKIWVGRIRDAFAAEIGVSATNAADSATAAATSESNAETSETNAANSATDSENSATASANSATDSANSAAAASTSANFEGNWSSLTGS